MDVYQLIKDPDWASQLKWMYWAIRTLPAIVMRVSIFLHLKSHNPPNI